jgi:Predicted site-specific integrase-resolvase
MILNNEVSKVIACPGRLVRFGFEMVEEVCKAHDCELVVLNGEDKTPEQELIEDLISSWSRSARNCKEWGVINTKR